MLSLKEEIEEHATKCMACSKDCPARPIMMYIHDVGLDYFCYQLENNKLPEQIRFAWNQCQVIVLFKKLAILDLLEALLDD